MASINKFLVPVMMKFISSLVLIVVVTAFYMWWKQSEYNKLDEEKTHLAVENKQLKDRLGEMKRSPDWLLKQAKLSLKREDVNDAKEKLLLIIYRYPNTKEVFEAKDLLKNLESKKPIKDNSGYYESASYKPNEVPLNSTKQFSNVLDKMYTAFNVAKDITTYYDKTSPRYNNVSGFYLYFKKDGKSGQPSDLKLKIQYTSMQPLNIQSYQFQADDYSFRLVPQKVEIDHDSHNSWEWCEVPINTDIYKLVNRIINSNSTVIRFVGRSNYTETEVSAEQKDALKNVLEAFKALGGKLNY